MGEKEKEKSTSVKEIPSFGILMVVVVSTSIQNLP